MRSTGSLLARALAVGGLTAAAWFFGGAVASASPVDHVPDASSISESVHAAIAEHHVSAEDTLVEAHDILVEAQDIREQWATTLTTAPVDLGFLDPARVPAGDEAVVEEPEEESSEDVSPVYYSGGIITSGTERSGTISNSMPEEQYTAKVAAKVAAKLAAVPPPPVVVEAPVEVAAPVVEAEVVVPVVAAPQWSIPAIHVAAPVLEAEDAPAVSGLEWEVPRPAAPAPTPQPAQAPTAPTASSSAHDNAGGARGGGVAVTTAQSEPHRPSLRTAARRDDGRTPGSVQGLPSSSPD